MAEFFSRIFYWFSGMYGTDLDNYLYCDPAEYNHYLKIGLIVLSISLFLAIVFYYVIGTALKKPSWCTVKTWLITLLINSIANFVFGWQFTLNHFNLGLMVDDSGNQLPIDESNCVMFGLACAVVGLLFFFVISVIIKWGSRNASRVPF